jgi:ABC-type glutathione transport system ATPase component
MLQLKNLTLKFSNQDQPTLSNISLSVDKEETLGIVGESGSGKTLTAHSILGLIPGSASYVKGQVQYQNEQGILQIYWLLIKILFIGSGIMKSG